MSNLKEQELYEKANGLVKTQPKEAVGLLQQLLSKENVSPDLCEKSLVLLGVLYQQLNLAKEYSDLLLKMPKLLQQISKAKTAKLVKQSIDFFGQFPDTLPLQVETVKKLMQWAQSENRLYLKQSLETKLVSLYLENRNYTETLALIADLLKELKRLDDKLVLTEVHLLESRCYHALRNLAKSRAALTSARTNANSIYCPPLLQAQLDLQSGILHAEDKDYKTAYSYFYETLEGFGSVDNQRGVFGLKYLLMSKIMMGQVDDVASVITGKLGLKYGTSKEVEAMKVVAEAYKERSLKAFEKALQSYNQELQKDPIVKFHLDALYDSLLEQNLTRLIEPFSRVQLSHVSELLQLPLESVEQKLSQMILDKRLNGILDQRHGTLDLYEPALVDETFPLMIQVIQSMSGAVDALYEKAKKL